MLGGDYERSTLWIHCADWFAPFIFVCDTKRPGSQLTAMATFVVVTGILYFGREVLIPLALSVLVELFCWHRRYGILSGAVCRAQLP